MARITKVEKAQKDQGKCRRCGAEILTGQPYYWFKNRIGRMSMRKVFCGAHHPKPSEMTTSEKLSELYGAQEDLETAIAGADNFADLAQALVDCAETARGVAEQYRESVQNMPENLQHGSQAQEMEEKADNIDSWADELEGAASEVEDFDGDVPDDSECASCGLRFDLHNEEARSLAEGEEDADVACEDFQDPRIDEAKDIASGVSGNLPV